MSSPSLSNLAMGKLTSSVRLVLGFGVDRANVYAGEKEDRMMMTGMHTVVDIYCVKCGSYLGWRYEFAFEKSQKYKEGKSVLERYKVCGPDENNYLVVAQEVEAGETDTDE